MQEAEKELECWIYRHPGSEMEPAAKGKVTIANTNDKEGDLNLSDNPGSVHAPLFSDRPRLSENNGAQFSRIERVLVQARRMFHSCSGC
jgi:hypothetical protein